MIATFSAVIRNVFFSLLFGFPFLFLKTQLLDWFVFCFISLDFLSGQNFTVICPPFRSLFMPSQCSNASWMAAEKRTNDDDAQMDTTDTNMKRLKRQLIAIVAADRSSVLLLPSTVFFLPLFWSQACKVTNRRIIILNYNELNIVSVL